MSCSFLASDAQPVLIADVDGDGFVLFQVADVLVDKSQRSVGRPFGDYVLLNPPVYGAISRYSGGFLGLWSVGDVLSVRACRKRPTTPPQERDNSAVRLSVCAKCGPNSWDTAKALTTGVTSGERPDSDGYGTSRTPHQEDHR
jgi:hypothetical protein